MPTLAHPDVLAVGHQRVGQQVEDPRPDPLAVVVVDVLEQHRELVAPHARRHVARSYRRLDPPGRGHEHRVAPGMPAAVVDRLEVVEIEEQHGDHACPTGQGRLDPP